MKQFSVPVENFDLELTMTCGQTFCWHRIAGDLYGEGSNRFYTFRNGSPIVVEQENDALFVETELSSWKVKEALGLDHDLDDIFSRFPEDEKLELAKEELWGLRVINDEFFPCLISYLCSPQMRIPRIKQMHDDIARKYGGQVEVNGHKLLRFPTLEELSEAREEKLRKIGVGYRAKYIVETIKILQNGFDHREVEEMDYRDAREEMKKLYGVGDKVADCVLLFSLGFVEAYPIDTWAQKSIKKHYPSHHSDSYDKVSENMRELFGGYAGYAQEYIFHAVRNNIIEVD